MPYLFSNVECAAAIVVLPIATECFTEARIVWLFETLGFLVESRNIPFDDQLHAGERIVFQHRSAKKHQNMKAMFFSKSSYSQFTATNNRRDSTNQTTCQGTNEAPGWTLATRPCWDPCRDAPVSPRTIWDSCSPRPTLRLVRQPNTNKNNKRFTTV